MKRFKQRGPWMGADANGDWVEHKDAAATIAILRAECEAWREWADRRFAGRTMYDGDEFQAIREARAATDAAGILKGAGT